MSDNQENEPSHFIRHIINIDREASKHDARVHTRFPSEPNEYLTEKV